MPERIQRKRTKGWRAPPGTLMCTRPGPWGNPFRAFDAQKIDGLAFGFRWLVGQRGLRGGRPAIMAGFAGEFAARDFAVYSFHCLIFRGLSDLQRAGIVEELGRYRHLACWCPLTTKACHVEVYLELLRKAAA